MRSISRGALLALLSTLALSAVVVSSAAAALPEFQKEGKPLKDVVTFTGTSGSSLWNGAHGSTGEYETGSISGEFKGVNEIANTSVAFGEAGNSFPCKGIEMKGKELKGVIGYGSKETHYVGALLEPTTQPFLTCGKLGIKITGSVIGSITPVNKATTKFSIVYLDERALQRFTHFEGSEVIHQLELNTFPEDIGLQAQFEITTSKAIEIKA